MALELHEALQTVPKALAQVRRAALQSESQPQNRLARLDKAFSAYKEESKRITTDKEFMEVLRTVRNGISAHHGLARGKGLEVSISWTLSAWKLSEGDVSPTKSKFADYALHLGRAIQEMGHNLSAS